MTELEAVEARVAEAELAVESAKAELSAARWSREFALMKAPKEEVNGL